LVFCRQKYNRGSAQEKEPGERPDPFSTEMWLALLVLLVAVLLVAVLLIAILLVAALLAALLLLLAGLLARLRLILVLLAALFAALLTTLIVVRHASNPPWMCFPALDQPPASGIVPMEHRGSKGFFVR
jgi:hypothetical protein